MTWDQFEALAKLGGALSVLLLAYQAIRLADRVRELEARVARLERRI